MKYLYPPKIVLNKKVTLNSLFEYDSKSNTFERKIFDVSNFETEINLSEKQKLNEISLNMNNLTKQIKKGEILRFLHINNMNCSLTKKKFLRSQRFLKRFELNGFSGRAENIIKKGSIYIFGRDKNYFPNLIIDIDELNCPKIKKKDIFESILYLSVIIIENMLIPYYLEQFNILFKFKNRNIFEFLIKFLKIFELIFCEILPMRINNIFYFDFPFKMDQFKMPLYLKDKIKNSDDILNYYEKNNLETKFKGLKKIHTVKWPPLTLSYEILTEEIDLNEKKIQMYKIFENHQLFFLITNEMEMSYFSNKIESNLYFSKNEFLIKSISSNNSFKKKIEKTFKLNKKYHSKQKFEQLYERKDTIRNILINSNYKKEKKCDQNKFSFQTFKKLLSTTNNDLKEKTRNKRNIIKSSKRPSFSKKTTKSKSIQDLSDLEDIIPNKNKILSFTKDKNFTSKKTFKKKRSESFKENKYRRSMKKENNKKVKIRRKSLRNQSLQRKKSIFEKSLKRKLSDKKKIKKSKNFWETICCL